MPVTNNSEMDMNFVIDDFDLDDSPSSDSSFVTPADTPAGNEKGHSRFLSYSGLSHQSSRSTLVSASDSQLDDGDIEDGGSANVSVVVRVRPLSDMEKKRGDSKCIVVQSPSSLLINAEKNKQFTFNHVFDGDATQQDVLDQCGIKKMVDMAMEGYACTAFAYGQTGSGKTFTITGPPRMDGRAKLRNDTWGLIQHSLVYLSDMINLRPKTSFIMRTSYLEIYNEQVKDLLNPNGRDSLQVRWSKDRGFYVENLFVMECETLDDMLAVLEEGMSQKAIATNNVNEHSSRSHTIMTLCIDTELPDPDDPDLYITKHGKLSFVDLAGSEKVKELGSSSELLSETTNINKSLLTLGNCISSLSDHRKRSGHIPYRDSKLTKLLADSLGGTGITLMIACISPSQYCLSESLNTLRYANRARRIKNKPVIRMDPREKLITSLKREVRLLRSENQYLRQRLEFPGTAVPASRIPPTHPNDSSTAPSDHQQPLAIEAGLSREGSEADRDLTPVANGIKAAPKDRREAPLEAGRKGGGAGGGGLGRTEMNKLPTPLARNETKNISKTMAADNSLYEMLQEYMVENETLRSENSDLHSGKEKARRDHDSVARENDRLLRKLEDLERVFTSSPYTLPSNFTSRTSSGQSVTSRGLNKSMPLPVGQSGASQPIKAQLSPQTQRSPQGHGQTNGNGNGTENHPGHGSPWRQQGGELPPLDSMKGIPDGYRSSQHPPSLSQGNREAPPTQRSYPSMSTQPPHNPPPTHHSYPRAHSNQTGGLGSTHPPPAAHSYQPTQKGHKKGSDAQRTSNTSQSFPPAPALQAGYTGSMGTLYEDHSNPRHHQHHHHQHHQSPEAPGVPAGHGGGMRSSVSDPTMHSTNPQSKTDIYIPSAPSTSLSKDTSQRKDTSNRVDLQTIQETGSMLPSFHQKQPPPQQAHGQSSNQPRQPLSTSQTSVGGAGTSQSNMNLRGKPSHSKQASTANTDAASVATGYSSKAKKNAWSGAGGGGTDGGGGGKNAGGSNNLPLNTLPKTPPVTPPVVKYKPQGSNKILAAAANNLDINYKGPDSDSLKDLNQKLREELQALDGEIEYMKYVNKNKANPAPAATKGKRR